MEVVVGWRCAISSHHKYVGGIALAGCGRQALSHLLSWPKRYRDSIETIKLMGILPPSSPPSSASLLYNRLPAASGAWRQLTVFRDQLCQVKQKIRENGEKLAEKACTSCVLSRHTVPCSMLVPVPQPKIHMLTWTTSASTLNTIVRISWQGHPHFVSEENYYHFSKRTKSMFGRFTKQQRTTPARSHGTRCEMKRRQKTF